MVKCDTHTHTIFAVILLGGGPLVLARSIEQRVCLLAGSRCAFNVSVGETERGFKYGRSVYVRAVCGGHVTAAGEQVSRYWPPIGQRTIRSLIEKADHRITASTSTWKTDTKSS